MWLFADVSSDSGNFTVLNDNNFTRLNVADKFSTNTVKCTSFRGENNSIALLTHTERSETPRVTSGNKFLRTHNDKRKRTYKVIYCLFNCLFNAL